MSPRGPVAGALALALVLALSPSPGRAQAPDVPLWSPDAGPVVLRVDGGVWLNAAAAENVSRTLAGCAAERDFWRDAGPAPEPPPGWVGPALGFLGGLAAAAAWSTWGPHKP